MNKYAANHAYITLRCALADELGWIEGVLAALEFHVYTDTEKFLERELHGRRLKITQALDRANGELDEARRAA